MDKEKVIDRLKRTTERFHHGRPYVIREYGKFYSVVVDGTEPFLYEKEHGFPYMLTYAQVSHDEKKNPKLIYESGGKDNGKK